MDIIVNRLSGRGRGAKNLEKVVAFCRKNNIDYRIHATEAAGDATKFAASIALSGAKLIVAMGGDGTFHEVLNGIPSLGDVEVGFIPSGRGNDFARGLGLPLDPIEALKLILDGKRRKIDYIRIGDKRCLNIAGTGLDIDVLQRVAGRQGKITYLGSLLYCVRHFEPYEIEVTLPSGEPKVYKAVMVGVCNGTQFGGGLKLSPASSFDDGYLDLVIIRMPKGSVIPPLIKFLRAKHLDLPITTALKCKEVSVRPIGGRPIQMDGEIYENRALDCSIVERGLNTFC